MPMSGRNTGISTASLVHWMAIIVWLATCPRLSPVMMAPHLSRFASSSAVLIINLLSSSMDMSSLHFSSISSWIAVNGTVNSVIRPLYAATFPRRSCTFCSAPLTCIWWRRKMDGRKRHPALCHHISGHGAVYAPDMSSIPRPPVPDGIPPAPFICIPLINASKSRISIVTVSSGDFTSTLR